MLDGRKVFMDVDEPALREKVRYGILFYMFRFM
jgi:hypothetical protein